MFSGSVDQLWRYPVKSMAGERVRSFHVDVRGVGGDRTHAVFHMHKNGWKPLTAREAPRLLAYQGEYPFAPGTQLDPAAPPPAHVAAPDGRRYTWPDDRLRRALGEDLGRDVRLHRDVDGLQDLERSLLVTVEATRRALETELSAPVDIRRFRPNVHLRLDAPAWSEHGWEGGRLEFEGGVVLTLLHACVRCAIPTRDPQTQEKWAALLKHLDAHHGTHFGVNARVSAGGQVRAGEAVVVHPPA